LGFCHRPSAARLATASSEAPGFVWDIYGKHAKAQAPPLTAADSQRLWQTLAGADAKAAFQAIRRLVGNPGRAVALLREQCKPAPPLDGKHVQQWLRALDSDDFHARQAAFGELEQLGDRVEGALADALKQKLGLESKRRVETLLAKIDHAAPECLRGTRALEALEQIATPDAVRQLETLAAGEPSARLTREAAVTLQRLRKN
jgi:hypothetical protein